jgi:hypothetical protein
LKKPNYAAEAVQKNPSNILLNLAKKIVQRIKPLSSAKERIATVAVVQS